MPELNNTILKDSANLMAYYRFESNVNDSSPSGYILTAVNSPTYESAKFGNGLKVASASSQYATIADASSANLDITGNQSWACWYKLSSKAADHFMAGIRASGGGSFKGIWMENGTSKIHFNLDGLTTNSEVASVTTVTTDTWYHIVGVYTGSALRIYINGKHDNSVAASGTTATIAAGFSIGRLGDQASSYANGVFDDFAIFNTALSADQIKELYEGRYVGEGWPQTGLVAGYHLNGNSTDFSGNSYNGTDTAITYSLANGKFSQGAGLNGSSSKVVITGNQGITSGAITINTWINPTAATSDDVNRTAIISHYDDTTKVDYRLGFGATGLFAARHAPNSSWNDTDQKAISTGVWQMATLVYDTTNIYLYHNGKLVDSSAASATGSGTATTATNFGIGASPTGASTYYNGKIDEVQIYNVAKDARWVRQQYALGVGKFY